MLGHQMTEMVEYRKTARNVHLYRHAGDDCSQGRQIDNAAAEI